MLRLRAASAERSMVALVLPFLEDGHHHIPIIDVEKWLGVVTESGFVRALYRSVVPTKGIVGVKR